LLAQLVVHLLTNSSFLPAPIKIESYTGQSFNLI